MKINNKKQIMKKLELTSAEINLLLFALENSKKIIEITNENIELEKYIIELQKKIFEL